MRTLLLALAMAAPGTTEILDRIAVTVNRQVITEGEVLRELRITRLIDGKPLEITPQDKRAAAERLVERALIQREFEFSRYPQPTAEDAAPLAAQVKARFPDEARWKDALATYQLTEPELNAYFIASMRSLRFTELRFRPGIQLDPEEIREEYERRASEWRERNNTPPPSLEESRADIEKLLVDQRVIQTLDRWLGATRTQSRIFYREEVFE